MKNLKKVLALVLAVVMIMSVVTVASAKTYTDVKATDNYADAIDALSSLKILDGFKDGDNYSFKAEDPFTRAQAAKIVAIVHNAATNGKIKDQDAISALYSNAQNPFVDCNNSWALPFINYCRITGLADGMTATTYEPNRYVTGVQFLKLMLTTLNFDTAKEGYTGTGWDVNVLNRANEVGLTAGLADGWKAIAPITRGEAAQVLYNALTKYLVEYGQLIKGFNPTNAAVYNAAFVSNEQVAKSGFTLAAKMGISIERATDAFRRPGYNWSYGSWSAFYMDAPVAEYKTAVTECTILKDAIGIPETKTTEIKLNGYVDGDDTKRVTKGTIMGEEHTALNYYAVDGFKYTEWNSGANTSVTLQHDPQKNCQKTSGSFKKHIFGGQGDLTQVFETEDGYVITTIHTFLANVDKLVLNDKYSHAKTDKATLSVYLDMTRDYPTYAEQGTIVKKTANVSFAEGTKVLVTMSLKNDEATNSNAASIVDRPVYTEAAVVKVTASEAKVGKLTGASDLAYTESVSIDGTKYPTACRFVLGKDDAMKFANYGKTFTFYFDSYGNVIGRDNDTTAANYVIVDKIWASHTDDGDFAIKANLYDLEGKAIEKADVAVAGSFANAKKGNPNGASYFWSVAQLDDIAANNDARLTNGLYRYTLSDKGVYTLTWVGCYNDSYNDGYGRLEGKFVHTAKLAQIDIDTSFFSDNTANSAAANPTRLPISESTKFVVKSVGAKWTTYTGYTALPELTASYMDYVDVDGDGFADIVYLGAAIFAGDSITGYVTNWGRFNWANGYDVVTVYVDGEPVYVNVKNPLGTTEFPTGNELVKGMYTFTMGTDKNDVAYATAYKKTADLSGYVKTKAMSADATAITLMTNDGKEQPLGLTDVAIYEVKEDGTVIKADASAIIAGVDYVEFYKASSLNNAPMAQLYIIDGYTPAP